MIRLVTSFDPSNPGAGTNFINNIQGNVGYLLITNDSMITIAIKYQGYTRLSLAGTFSWIKIRQSVDSFDWAQVQVFPNVGSAPSSVVYVEGADVSEAEYVESMATPVALPRLTNLGNTVPINTSATSVVNDGNVVGTTVVEGTPAASTSQLKLANDGTGYLGNGNLLIGATQITAQNGYTINPAVIGAGALGAGVTMPNYVLKAGDTMSGTLVLAKALGGVDAELLQLQSSDASVPARWTINMTTGNNALKILDNTSGGVAMLFYTNAKIGLSSMGTQGFSGVGIFGGAATGTYTHGLTVVPATVLAMQKVLNATNTYGSDTYGSTSVHITVFASPQTFTALAIV